MQSADKNAQGWLIQFDPQERWENNTMGWGSSADPLSNVDGWISFKTKEAAVDFANRQGWEVIILDFCLIDTFLRLFCDYIEFLSNRHFLRLYSISV